MGEAMQRFFKIINVAQGRRIGNLEAEIESQAEHIDLLQQCDDSSTEVVGKMDGEIEILEGRNHHLKVVIAAQKQTIKNQGAGCEARHNTLCEIQEIIDHYFMKG